LLGLIYGHYDTNVGEIDSIVEDLDENKKVNTGIAIVTPITKLIELFKQEKIIKHEALIDKKIAKKKTVK
jgi:hypothetical protein